MNQLKEDIKKTQGTIDKKVSNKREISLIRCNVDFLQDSEIEQLQKELDKLQLIIGKTQSSPAQKGNASNEVINSILQACLFKSFFLQILMI